MKKIYHLVALCCLFLLSQVQAKVITVSNKEGDIAPHKTIESALLEAVDGDIIYVSGSPTTYGDFNISKQVTLIGSGHNPENQDPLISQLGSVTLGTNSSGSKIIGFRITSITNSSGIEVNDIEIKRNRITGQSSISINIGSNSKNWVIEENILLAVLYTNADPAFLQLHTIKNNILNNVTSIRYSFFINNVFINPSGIFFSSISNSFSNNIFFQNNLNSSFGTQIFNCDFNYNIFFGSNNPTSLPTVNNNNGENNIFSNPLFVSVPNNSFSYNFDYNLQATSPGLNAGNDETDIGLFGGMGYSVSGEPAIPKVTLLNILNPSVPQSGDLNVRIEGKSNN